MSSSDKYRGFLFSDKKTSLKKGLFDMTKTNALRMLDSAGIKYECKSYQVDESDLSGTHIAQLLGVDPDSVFKTLVCRDDKGGHHVFCIPAAEELDLKKCATAAKVKRVEMIPVKELLPLTGYIRGGCSPVGMKKSFPTYIDETAELFDKIYLSAGQRGLQMLVSPDDIAKLVGAVFSSLIR